ncbi:uncharacterized protein LOC115049308 [Echeneis naucrates]|uniref:uncharacterized protein LOC115049308 n=1 Tax=Echeneis naucrates TaxID=173247 RepID=UPI001113EE63|nr:uncharacterized protein LOC115049308 [Echeneis naucrates]
MFACETETVLQRLALLVVCHGFAVGQTNSRYFPVQRPMSWSKAREFCQRHYVDLAVLNTEEQYFALLNATHGNKGSFWLGLQRHSVSSWTWVNGEEMTYKHWYRRNEVGCCASLEAMLEKDEKLLARYCDELHMFVCQGPVSPQPVAVNSVSTDQLNLSWNVSAFMQMTLHSYNVTTCTRTCDTRLYSFDSAFMNINISNLTSATEYFIEITAFVVRPDRVSGGNMTLQGYSTVLQVKTAETQKWPKVPYMWKLLKFVFLAPPLWIVYICICFLKEQDKISFMYHDAGDEASSAELSTEDSIIELIPETTRGIK